MAEHDQPTTYAIITLVYLLKRSRTHVLSKEKKLFTALLVKKKIIYITSGITLGQQNQVASEWWDQVQRLTRHHFHVEQVQGGKHPHFPSVSVWWYLWLDHHQPERETNITLTLQPLSPPLHFTLWDCQRRRRKRKLFMFSRNFYIDYSYLPSLVRTFS